MALELTVSRHRFGAVCHLFVFISRTVRQDDISVRLVVFLAPVFLGVTVLAFRMFCVLLLEPVVSQERCTDLATH